MPVGQTVRIEGYREFLRACDKAEKNTKKYVRGTFRKVGDVIREDATHRLAPVSPKSAAGYRTRVRQSGIVVEQSLRKTTGLHPEWGAYQMRNALVPAIESREDDVNRELERAIDQVADHFEARP